MWPTVIVAILVFGIVAAIIGTGIRNKIKGTSCGCGCNCSSCGCGCHKR